MNILSEHICLLEKQVSVRMEEEGERDTQSENRVSVLKEPTFEGHIPSDLFSVVRSRKQLVCVLWRPSALFYQSWRQCPGAQ